MERLFFASMPSLALVAKRGGIKFTLAEPDEGQVCPITQEPIATSTLDFLDCPFDLEHPERKALCLPCQHTFAALCLVFHWARNDTVLCPLCRAGPRGARLNLRCLPAHFRRQMGRRVRESKRRDQVEAIRDNELAARRLVEVEPHHFFCVMHSRFGVEYAVRMTGVCVQDQMVFVASGSDIRNFLVAVHEAMLTVVFESEHASARFPSSAWFAAPGFRTVCATAPSSSFQYFVTTTPVGGCIRFNVPTFLFTLITGLDEL
jgi:hypothetical protein